MTPNERVVIVGAGAAGLSTAGALSRLGIDALVIDRAERIGDSWARRYERLRLHTIRRFSGLAHYPIPHDRDRYLPKDEYARYLREYAERFRLRVALSEPVSAIQPSNGAWEVVTSHRTLRAEHVVVATGHYAEPAMPVWDGVSEFGGRLVHSAEYSSGAEFVGLRALVVGLGNSGAEIATDLVEQGAAWVAVAVRRAPPIVLREMFGVVPVQLFGLTLGPLGMPRAVDRVGRVLRRLTVGDLRRYGIGEAAWGPFTARRPPLIDVGFLPLLKSGRIVVRPALQRLTATGVEYADGAREDVDLVVAATGFRTGLARLLAEVSGVVDDDGLPVTPSGATAARGLYTVGFDESVRGHLFEARKGSLRLASAIADELRGAA